MADFAVGDRRTAARGEWVYERIAATGSLTLKVLGDGRAGEMGIQRYLSSPHVTPEVILAALSERTAQACRGRRIVAAQDTTEINFAGRGGARKGLGPAGDGKSPGFFIHPTVAIDADEETVLGIVDAHIWTRDDLPVEPRAERLIEDKESIRWINAAKATAGCLTEAAQIVLVSDQESDIYPHFARRPPSLDLVVRARHDRTVSPERSMRSVAAQWPIRVEAEVRVAPRGPGDKGRIAQVVIRSDRLTIKRPQSSDPTDPPFLEMGLVEVSEPNPPAGVKPLSWRLLTTLPVDSAEAAQEVVRLYRLRWRIEEVFRALKSDGLKLEDTQVHTAERLFLLAMLGLGAAARIIQLVDARDGSSRPMTDVLDAEFAPAVALLSRHKEGGSERQKNHHPPASLAWLAWVVARYGGWNCYGKPPGPKTMAYGWQAFAAALSGVIIAQAEALA